MGKRRKRKEKEKWDSRERKVMKHTKERKLRRT